MQRTNFFNQLNLWLNNRARAILAGLSLSELRAISRGEPPTARPNPRYLAHTLSFLLHIRPRFYPLAATWFTHTFHLGFFTVFFFVVEIITGLILMIYYAPTPQGAYESILKITSEVPFGALTRDIHRLAGEGMLVFAVLHLLRAYITASYKKERAFTWVTGVALLALTMGLMFSGYLLPWDQLAYWAVTIGTSMAEAAPLVGRELNLLLRGSADIGGDGLLRFYLLHVVLLPLLTGVVLAAHYYRVARRHGISLPAHIEAAPPEIKEKATQRVNFIPDIFTYEVFLVSLGLLALIAVALFGYDAPLEHHADPGYTPLNTEAPWFFLWVQGLLKLGDKTLMGVIIPALLFAALLAAPYLDRSPHRLMRRRPLALTLAGAVIIVLAGLTYMGTHHYGITMPAATQIVETLAPEEGTGPLQAASFDQLVVGVYEINKTDPHSLPPELGRVFSQFEQQVNAALPQAGALLIIEDWQANLKKVTLRIIWADPAGAGRKTHERVVYLHRDR